MSSARALRGLALSAAVMIGLAACEDPDQHSTNALPTSPAAARGQGNGKIANQFVVVLKDGQSARARAREIAAAHGGEVMHVYGAALNGFSMRLPEAALNGLRNNPHVAYVEPDFTVSAQVQTLPTGIDHAEADGNSYARIDGVDDVMDLDIAILDSGIDTDHPDLRLGGSFKNCIDTTNDDLYGHGTHVAGIAAAKDNGDGVVGMAPGARVWPVKVLDNYGSGTLSSVICGIDHVTANAAQIEVANLSLGGAMLSDALHTAVRNSVNAGVVLVAAAGNSRVDVYGPDLTFGTSDDFVPAAYPEVATVSALADSDGKSGGAGNSFAICGTVAQMDDAFACFSNYSQSVAAGNPVTSSGGAIDLAAPGVAILSTYPGGGTSTMDGTSMAAPHAAGAAALYIRERGTRDVNADGVVNAADVYAIRQALIDRAVAQSSWRTDGATSDRDANQERGLRVGTSSTSAPAPAPTPVAPTTTPDAGSLTVTERTTGNTATFLIQNNGSSSESFSLACAFAGNVGTCSTPTSTTVAAGGTAEVPVSFSAGAAGSGSVSLTATGQGGSDGGSYDVTIQAAAPAPAPTAAAHVHAINVSSVMKAQSTESQAQVLINDGGELPVRDATVVGDWYHNGTLVRSGSSGTTNDTGEARVRGPRLKVRAGDAIQFCVTEVRHSGYTYSGTANHESCDGFTVASK